MSAERWQLLSEWHVAWLAADRDACARVRSEAAIRHPDLLVEIDSLAESRLELDEFLETPALELLAADLTHDSASLIPGWMVGPYRVVALLASGGMGDVYRATDVRLRRDVALKVLNDPNAGDTVRVERFLQEARLTASLDHPNVVRLYDVGLFEGRPFLVAELLDGETLRGSIERGPLPPNRAVQIAIDVARGLVAAHGTGLVHRDLKPENVFLTTAGGSKILDFGIAKLTTASAGDALNTLTGVLLGTAGYLAPEQVRGDPVDSRADLFALGSMLFEMLTGRRAFAREHTIDTLHAIVHERPPDLLGTCAGVSPRLADIVMRLLQKEPDQRFGSSADVIRALECVDRDIDRPFTSRQPVRRLAAVLRSQRLRRICAVTAAVVSVIAMSVWWTTRSHEGQSAKAQLTEFAWSAPDGSSLDSAPVVSPDGRSIAFTGLGDSGARLFVRRLDSIEALAIPGTVGAKQPFWSPDGTSLGYFAAGKLMRVAVAGGAPVVIGDAPDGRGGAWSATGIIVFSPDLTEDSLWRVAVAGGVAEPATLLNVEAGENSHRWPVMLPDGRHFLYFVRADNADRRGVYVGRLDTPAERPARPLFRSESEVVYAQVPGTTDSLLLSVDHGHIEVRRFDAAGLVLIGEPRLLPLAAGGNTPYHPAMIGATADVLAYVTAAVPFGTRFTSVRRDGTDLVVSPERESQNWPRMSPEGHRIARQRIDPVEGNPDIWVDDLTRGTHVRVTTAPDRDILPVWSPDGQEIAYVTGRFDQRHLSVAAADGTGVVTTLRCPDSYCEPTDWSPDGTQLLVNVRGREGADVWVVPTDAEEPSRPVLAEPFVERDARFSPDGRWLAYVSEESGRPEVSVRSVGSPAHRVVISANGGSEPVWRRDGTELFFVDLTGRLQSAAVHARGDGPLAFSRPVTMKVPPIGAGHWGTQYDVSPDGRRVYYLGPDASALPPHEVNVVLGWRTLLASAPR